MINLVTVLLNSESVIHSFICGGRPWWSCRRLGEVNLSRVLGQSMRELGWEVRVEYINGASVTSLNVFSAGYLLEKQNVWNQSSSNLMRRGRAINNIIFHIQLKKLFFLNYDKLFVRYSNILYTLRPKRDKNFVNVPFHQVFFLTTRKITSYLYECNSLLFIYTKHSAIFSLDVKRNGNIS